MRLETLARDTESCSNEQYNPNRERRVADRLIPWGVDAEKHDNGLLKEFRAMTAPTVDSRLALGPPNAGLKPQALALNVIKRNLASGGGTGGIGLFMAGREPT